jgi:hypothetical protein
MSELCDRSRWSVKGGGGKGKAGPAEARWVMDSALTHQREAVRDVLHARRQFSDDLGLTWGKTIKGS